MFLEYLTEYFKKKAVHAHCTVFHNVTLLKSLGLKLITYFCLVRTGILFHTESTARNLKDNSPLLFYQIKMDLISTSEDFMEKAGNRHNFCIRGFPGKGMLELMLMIWIMGIFKNCIITFFPWFPDRAGIGEWECLLLGRLVLWSRVWGQASWVKSPFYHIPR